MPSYNLSATLTTEEALHFACWAIAQERAAEQVHVGAYLRGPYRTTIALQALEELLQAYPPVRADADQMRIFERLQRQPDRRVLAAYFRRISERGAAGERNVFAEGADEAWWQVYRTWLDIAEARAAPETAPRPLRVDVLERATPQEALDALRRIPEGAAPAQGGVEEAAILAGIQFWIRAFPDGDAESRRPKTCVCDTLMIHPLRPEDHLARCPRDPTWLEVAKLQQALRLAGVRNPPGPDVERVLRKPGPGEHTPWLTERCDGQGMLEAWQAKEERAGRGNQPPRTVVAAILREGVRLAHPDQVPCPWCGDVVGLSGLAPHLRVCLSHPAQEALRALQAACAERGLTPDAPEVARAAGYEAARRGLRELIDACERFKSDQGWDGENSYSKPYAERPWREALDRAGALVAPLETAAPSEETTARFVTALAELLAACRTYWNRADEGDRGRSVFSAAQDTAWSKAIEKARAVLESRVNEPGA